MTDELVYYGYSGQTAWAFTTPEELGVWAAEHPEGTFDVAVRGDARQSHCKRGHPLAADASDRAVGGQCRECSRPRMVSRPENDPAL